MSGTLTRPDWAAAIKDLARRVGMLERRTTPATAVRPTNTDTVFSYAGELESSTDSPPATVRYAGTLAVIAVAFGAAGSTDTILELIQNGTSVATHTFDGGVTQEPWDVDVRVAAEDLVVIRVDTAGTGAADMTAAARFT